MTADEFRTLALALPGAREGAHNGHPDFRVGGRIFASLGAPDAGHAMAKLARIEQDVVVAAAPNVFSPAAGSWGLKGSTLIHLPQARPEQVEGALRLAWRHLAPKPLLNQQDALPR